MWSKVDEETTLKDIQDSIFSIEEVRTIHTRSLFYKINTSCSANNNKSRVNTVSHFVN